MSVSEVFNIDNMEYMKTFPDKFFDLVIADPPYGIGFDGEVDSMVTNNASGKWKNAKGKGYKRGEWDNKKPEPIYFEELFRISKAQIIWGGNYFNLPISGGWIVWDKIRPETFSLSQAELAWVSNSGRVSIFKYLWNGFQKQKPEERFHPTQKPFKLYQWLLSNYAKKGDKIFDPNMGSQSSRIAAYDMGFDYWGCELDKEYFDKGNQRFENFKKQLKLL